MAAAHRRHALLHEMYPILLIILVCIVVDHIEESKLVDTLRRGDHSEPISQLLFLEEFLCPNEDVLVTVTTSKIALLALKPDITIKDDILTNISDIDQKTVYVQ